MNNSKKGKIFVLIVLSTLLLAIFNYALVYGLNFSIKSMNENYSKQLTLDNFEGFQRAYEDEYISSHKTNNYINFSTTVTPEYGTDQEGYVYKSDNYGPITDFSMYMEFDYNFSGINCEVNFILAAGSYYKEDGEFVGNNAYTRYFHICSLGIMDYSSTLSARHEIKTYPYDFWLTKYNLHGSVGLTGKLAAFAERSNNITVCQIIDPYTQEIILNKTITMGLDRQVNFFYIEFSQAEYGDYMVVTATDIRINATYSITETTSVDYISYSLAIPFIVFLYALRHIILYRKKSKKWKS